VVRVDFEHSRVGCPGTADCLKRCFPLQRFEVLGKVVSRDEGQDVCAQYLCGVAVKRLGGRFLHCSVHPLGLTVGPRMIRLGEPVLDATLLAHTVKRMLHHVVSGRSILGESYAVVGQHSADLIRKGFHDATEKR
jgi:hypothetical protein